GNETGVDCGGPDCPACPPSDPTDGPGNNSSTGTDFIIYGDGSNGVSDFTNFNVRDFGGGVVDSQPDLNGDTVLRLDNIDFFGSGFGEVFNATGTYSFVHLNYYATTANTFNFSLVDQSLAATVCCGNAEEPFFRFGPDGAPNDDAPLTKGSWVSIFIPLSHFANYPPLVSGTWDGADLIQTLITGDGTIFLDNIFFSTSDTLGAEEFANIEFKVFPNPTRDNWEIVSNNVVSRVQIFDILGKEVLTVNPNEAVTAIDASSLNKGVYFANITTSAGTSTVKLVKN
ncbi:MAG: T9SS type A sorting domain-containing protein, partial [Psychroserpens sp.]|nr:T9SS type A sorting domain-containing protein [Psychroserpens sp.]